MIKPLGDRLLITPKEKETKTSIDIIIPEGESKEIPDMGVVDAIGPEVTDVQVGDKVVFMKYGPDEVEIDGKKVLIAKEADVLGILVDKNES